MILIPKQLVNQKFILCKEKRPLQKQWSTLMNYSIDDNILLEHLSQQPTYGVLAGGDSKLIIVDFDCQEAQDQVAPLLPRTFTVKTAGKGLYHLYYFSDDTTTRRILSSTSTSTLIDVQGTGTFVVGPNSILKNGKAYEVVNDEPVATIYHADLFEIISKNLKVPFKSTESDGKVYDKNFYKDMEVFASPEVLRIKQALKVSTLLAEQKVPIQKNPTECPWHLSEHKACLSFNDNKNGGLWHCFHCLRSGDVITLYGMTHDLTFKQTIAELNRKLFIDHKQYEDKLKFVADNINERKNASITPDDINTIAGILMEHFKFVTMAETEAIYYYDKNKGVYKPLGKQVIEEETEKYFDGLSRTHITNEIVNKIKRRTYKSVREFDKHKNLVCLANGVFNLETKLLIPYSPEYLFLNYLPIQYNESATCPKFEKFASEVVSQEDLPVLYEILGFLLMKDYDIQKAILLVGGGANGKSVFLHVLKSVIGMENMSAEGLQALCSELSSTAQLFGKIANISGDISSIPVKYTGKIKDLTSGADVISAQFKFQQKFTFVNYAKLIFGCNTVPASDDLTNGYIRRWKILKFPNTFEGANDNQNLKYELTTEDELSGLFNIAVEQYYKLKQAKAFSNDKNVDETREEYVNLSDPLQVFIDKYLVQDNNSQVPKIELYDKYNEFAKERCLPTSSAKALTIKFAKKNMRMKTAKYLTNNGYTTREVLEGYCFKDKLLELDEEEVIQL